MRYVTAYMRAALRRDTDKALIASCLAEYLSESSHSSGIIQIFGKHWYRAIASAERAL